MKKSFIKRAISILLTLVLLISAVPMTVVQVSAAAYTGIMRQTESQWLNYSFNGGTLYATGCGIFSLANAVGYLTGEKMDVVEIATWAHNNGMYNVTGADGTYRTSFYQRASARYGPTYGFTIDCSSDGGGYWSGAYDAKLKNHLEGGGTAVIHVYNHFMALVGYDRSTNKFHLYDCAPRDRRNTLANGGDLWFTEAQLSSGYTDIDWFCLVSPLDTETWVEKAAFDPAVYRGRYNDLKDRTDEQLKEHWLAFGIKEGRAASTVLDLRYYLENNPDLKEKFGTDYKALYEYFITTGYKERRKTSQLFDGKYYCEKYPDVVTTYKDSFMRHYVDHGMKEGRRGSETFDVNYYLFIRPDVAEMWSGDLARAARHFAGYGIKEGREGYDCHKPVISDVKFSNITASGYTVTCKVTDNWGVSKVSFPTWSVANGQDDLAKDYLDTQLGTKNGDIYTFNVKTSDHNNETGFYATHIYAKDKGGNVASLSVDPIEVKDPVSEITLNSDSKCEIGEGLLSKVNTDTTVEALLKEFENEKLEVVDCNGNVISGSTVVGTGSQIKLYENDELVDTVTVVILGDVDGNGNVETTDYMRVKSAFLSSFTLNGAQNSAADVDGSVVIDSTDYMRIKSHFLGTYDLFE